MAGAYRLWDGDGAVSDGTVDVKGHGHGLTVDDGHYVDEAIGGRQAQAPVGCVDVDTIVGADAKAKGAGLRRDVKPNGPAAHPCKLGAHQADVASGAAWNLGPGGHTPAGRRGRKI